MWELNRLEGLDELSSWTLERSKGVSGEKKRDATSTSLSSITKLLTRLPARHVGVAVLSSLSLPTRLQISHHANYRFV